MHPARHRWVRKRVLSLGVHEPVPFTGGVSRSRSLVRLLERRRDCAVDVSPDSQFAGALGRRFWRGGGQSGAKRKGMSWQPMEGCRKNRREKEID